MISVNISYSPLTAGEHTVGLCADFTGWRIIELPSDKGVYSFSFNLRPGRYLYKLVVDGMWMEDPANPLREADPFGGYNSVLELGEELKPIRREAIADFDIPNWVKEGIVYQIFPERFCNGDASLNPDFSEPYYQGATTKPQEGQILAPWQEYYHFVEDWYEVSGLRQNPYMPKGKPDWWSFYGGDLKGVRQKLDYLSELGITIIYFNPLWKAKSNHKYDAADFLQIDPHFGSTQDMKALVEDAHSRGIRVILDIALNHTGESFWAFQDCVEKGAASAWWKWYDWKKWPLPQTLTADFKPKDYYQCWWGIKDMPDLNYDLSRQHPWENTIHAIEDAEPNSSLIEHLKEVCRWWLVEIDIDGFRLDVPDEVPWWFWELWRKWVKSFKTDAWLVGEIWHDATQWVSPKYFDSVMNYAYFKAPVHDFFLKKLISRAEFIRRLSEGLEIYPPSARAAMMNLLGSHDTWRIWELDEEAKAAVLPCYLFMFCYIGAPHIYYGDEVGMMGAGDPDNRRPFNWRWESDQEAVKTHSLIKEMIALRKAHAALVYGDITFTVDHTELLRFTRFYEGHALEVIINPRCDSATCTIDEGSEIVFKLGEAFALDSIVHYLPPHSALVLELAQR